MENKEREIQFRKSLKTEIIPFVEGMLEKERLHLSRLKSLNAPKEFILSSQRWCNHYESRVSQYREISNQE